MADIGLLASPGRPMANTACPGLDRQNGGLLPGERKQAPSRGIEHRCGLNGKKIRLGGPVRTFGGGDWSVFSAIPWWTITPGSAAFRI
ncbi:hypothetical protein [Pseudofrankia sp. BMG5.36]|uniref:hypothetical protein n=1 Tax=Pseudofrankia sp. BMG5.36 TaxID=1834512 RepID=UPI001041DADA|nr:hypothetical protein [Pseudofrankia sp. BMG5.36]